ncbi:bifunctional apoptosis regulator-like [Paramacrobiotus metropolitanus]|uniref:bifunctional apoptosis regulator-like n=1 Tax=Paramacrobiotus metropolitanus TaxID=2943436 RepID=UPI0024458A0A|nr:bifunctional apoptosis regulator-like [Paramacrobiotus metropolitanus]XP_055341311.1 bifunctional apoptosis regulator-like [Paramacrobiotus metropolitanus]XP_055341312.1 bifunctional apoptosis regulator-like [Paramacrobiotus metropolitanus]XP_055341313.1 bifunctional apoptosis regulator-like [Paramacrobiotus metropolitanus]
MPANIVDKNPKSRKRTLKYYFGKIWSKNQQDNRLNSHGQSGLGSSLNAAAENLADNALRDRYEEKLARERVRQSLECPICTDIFLDPVNLSCGHTFCLHCLANDYVRRDKANLVCCICRDSSSKNVIISRTLRDVVEGAFPDEERHRRETLTLSDRQALTKLMADQNKTQDTLKMERFFLQARYGLLACAVFILWFFYWD